MLAPGGKGPLSFGGFGPGTDARVKSLYYYPGARLTQELVKAQMTLHLFEKQQRQALKARRLAEADEEASKAVQGEEMGQLDAFDRQLMQDEMEMSDSMNKAMLATQAS